MRALRLSWKNEILSIEGEQVPGKRLSVLYIEAFCRPNSHTTDWGRHTVIPHSTNVVSSNHAGTRLMLRSKLADGVIVDHVITSTVDEVNFRITAYNPGTQASEAHWAQPCVRVGAFTGLGDPQNPQTYEYLAKSFVFIGGRLQRMPTKIWATEARYVPGQVWAAPGVPRQDVNPRPLNSQTPSNGLIGCYSRDETMMFATAFEPYQELFQGVITCLHSDFRIGGLQPGETKHIRGKLYLVDANVENLLARFRHDFPEQAPQKK